MRTRRVRGKHSPASQFDGIAGSYNSLTRKLKFISPRKVASKSAELLDGKTNPMIIDLGAGTGLVSKALKESFPNSKITALDVSYQMLQEGKDYFDRIIKCDIAREPWPLRDRSADCIVMSGVAEFLDEESLKTVFERAARILKPGGYFVFTFEPGRRAYERIDKRPLIDTYKYSLSRIDNLLKDANLVSYKDESERFLAYTNTKGENVYYRTMIAQKPLVP